MHSIVLDVRLPETVQISQALLMGQLGYRVHLKFNSVYYKGNKMFIRLSVCVYRRISLTADPI